MDESIRNGVADFNMKVLSQGLAENVQ